MRLHLASEDCPQMQSDLLPHSGMFQLLHVMSSKISVNFLHLTWRIYFNIYEFITFIKNPKAHIYSKNMRFSEIHRLVFYPYTAYLFLISAQKWMQWHSRSEGISGISSWPSFFLFNFILETCQMLIMFIPISRPQDRSCPRDPSSDHKSKPISACTWGNSCQGNLTDTKCSPPTQL